MTLQLRPTFSESWYRVASLKARLRSTTQITRQYYRGERWYVVRDPAGNQFHRLSDAAYRFVGLLDGSRTVAQAWELVGGQLEDDAPTQPEVIQILSQLHAANLLEADISPDAGILLRRHKQMLKRQMQGRLMNLLFPRIPLWDPDAFLKRWMPLANHILSPLGIIVWIIVVAAAIFALTGHGWAKVMQGASAATDPSNWIFLWATFVLIKFIHECGHAFACRRFGGEVHEMGIMFLVFIPTPYVEASSAWSFASRWKRMFVGAAGMIFELFIASLMAFVWINTNPQSLWHQLAYNAMLIASVTTILFNANPLLRYDGYYMLSDWLEIPNLQQKSTEYLLGLIKRHIFHIKPRDPLPPPVQRAWLLFYGIASTIYRVFVGIMIILFVAYRVPMLGVLMAAGGVVTWLVMPVVKLVKYLTLNAELQRKRGRAWAFTAAVTALIVLLIGIVPFPSRFYGDGIVEPLQEASLFMAEPGFVRQIPAQAGQWLHKGDPILICQSPEIDAQVKQMKHQLEAARLKVQATLQLPGQNEAAREEFAAAQSQLQGMLLRQEKLTLRAPFDGELVAPQLHYMLGQFLPARAEVARVISRDQLLIRTVVKQQDYEQAKRAQLHDPDKPLLAALHPQVRLASRVATTLYPREVDLVDGAQADVAHASLTYLGGGDLAPDPRDQRGVRTQVQQFQVRIILDNPRTSSGAYAYLPGQRATVRFTALREPLALQWIKSFLRLIQTESMQLPAGVPTR